MVDLLLKTSGYPYEYNGHGTSMQTTFSYVVFNGSCAVNNVLWNNPTSPDYSAHHQCLAEALNITCHFPDTIQNVC